MDRKQLDEASAAHRPIKPHTHVICQACPNTPWTIEHFYQAIHEACSDDGQ